MPGESYRSEIEEQLKRILDSRRFRQAQRLSDFLRYIVIEALQNEQGANLKETTIAVGFFGRDPEYNPAKFSQVRTTAARVRQRLLSYYEAEGAEDPWLITLPEEGYVPRIVRRLVHSVEPDGVPAISNNLLECHSATPPEEPAEAGSNSDSMSVAGGVSRVIPVTVPERQRAVWKTVALMAVLGLALVSGATVWNASRRAPTVVAYTALTNDAHEKVGPLLSDGKRLYFDEVLSGNLLPYSVSIAGGPATPIAWPAVRNGFFLDFQSGAFLICGEGEDGKRRLWNWQGTMAPSPLSVECAGPEAEAMFGQMVDGQLRVSTMLAPGNLSGIRIRGYTQFPRWSDARQQLRFTVADPPGEKYSLWKMGLHGQPEPLVGYPDNSRNGTWSSDGRKFIFQARRDTADGGDDIWLSDEKNSREFGQTFQLFRLTHGPLDYSYPLPGSDNRTIFAIGTMEKLELVRVDATGACQPFLGGVSAFETDFSRDGRWIAYASHPDRTLWKIRPDGSGALRLTAPPLIAVQPHWSPDGARIAFMGQLPGKSWRIYLISSAGGQPQEATEIPGDQGVPTWSADGQKIVFGELLLKKPGQAMTLHILDLANDVMEPLPDSFGLFTPRWSPDGRFILATTSDFHELRLFDFGTRNWQTLARFNVIDNPTWSADSSYIYFNSKGKPNVLDNRLMAPAVYRFDLLHRQLQRLLDLTALDVLNSPWYGIEPDGTLLAARVHSLHELYRLDLKW